MSDFSLFLIFFGQFVQRALHIVIPSPTGLVGSVDFSVSPEEGDVSVVDRSEAPQTRRSRPLHVSRSPVSRCSIYASYHIGLLVLRMPTILIRGVIVV